MEGILIKVTKTDQSILWIVLYRIDDGDIVKQFVYLLYPDTVVNDSMDNTTVQFELVDGYAKLN